jgi:hypothetical protein
MADELNENEHVQLAGTEWQYGMNPDICFGNTEGSERGHKARILTRSGASRQCVLARCALRRGACLLLVRGILSP